MTVRTKRRRARSGTAVGEVDEKHKRFSVWARSKGVEITNVDPQHIAGRGLGLVATRHIKEGSRILFVPEASIFKPDFSFLRRNRLESISSQAKLAISSLNRFASSSPDCDAWAKTWPTQGDFSLCMPIFWPEEVTDYLPRSVDAPLRRQRSDYQKDWLECKKVVHDLGFDETRFKYYWMIVNSRSFHWAPPRGGQGYMVLCPFIDYLNHGRTGSGCNVFQRSDGYEVIAQADYSRSSVCPSSYWYYFFFYFSQHRLQMLAKIS